MKATINNKVDQNTAYYVVMGVIDENGKYNESYLEDVYLRDLPKRITKVLRKGYDVTVHIEPKSDIVFFFKSRDLVEQYLDELQLGPESFGGMLTAFSKYDNPTVWCFSNVGDLTKRGGPIRI